MAPAGGAIEPVTSLAAAGAAGPEQALARRAACRRPRSVWRVWRRLDLRLLDLVEAVAGLVELAHRRSWRYARRWPSARRYRLRSAPPGLRARCYLRPVGISGHQVAEPRGRQRATERAGHRRQRHHGGHRRHPALAGRGFACRLPPSRRRIIVVPGAIGGRHDHELTGESAAVQPLRSQPWRFGNLEGFNLTAFQPWAFRPWASRPWARPPWARFLPVRAPARGLDLGRGRCHRPLGADMSGAAGPVPTDPVSPLVGSHCCSLTFKFSRMVDHLVTFIACEIVTGGALPKF